MEAHNARTHLTDLRACDPRVIMALPPSSGFLNGLGSAGRENDDDDDDDLGLDSFELSAQLSPPRGREGRASRGGSSGNAGLEECPTFDLDGLPRHSVSSNGEGAAMVRAPVLGRASNMPVLPLSTLMRRESGSANAAGSAVGDVSSGGQFSTVEVEDSSVWTTPFDDDLTPSSSKRKRQSPKSNGHKEQAKAQRVKEQLKREQRLAYCVQVCLDKGWGYRRAISSEELRDYVHKSEAMTLKRWLANAKKTPTRAPPVDKRAMLYPDDEAAVYSWVRMCNRVEMPVSNEMLARAVVRTLEARHEAESKPGYDGPKTVQARQLKAITAQSVTPRFLAYFKARHPDILIGDDSAFEMQTRAQYAAAGVDTSPWSLRSRDTAPPVVGELGGHTLAAAAAVVPPPPQTLNLGLDPFSADGDSLME